MFTTLVESRATRTRHARGTMASVALHAAAIAAAIVAGSQTPVQARALPERIDHIVYNAPLQAPAPRTAAPSAPTTPAPAVPAMPPLVVVPPTEMPSVAPVIVGTGAPLPPEQVTIGGGVPVSGIHATGASTGLGGGGEAVGVELVDRAPRVIGAPVIPRYPSLLREGGVSGSVTLRFVIDTTGRAEEDGITVVQSTHPLFTEAVRSALPQYRFAPGEVEGRKVRTLVSMPFTFALRR